MMTSRSGRSKLASHLVAGVRRGNLGGKPVAIGEIYERLHDRYREHEEGCQVCQKAPAGAAHIHDTIGLCDEGAKLWKAVLEFDTE
jgi:hypothetical protein